jgi:dihydrofolate reductase
MKKPIISIIAAMDDNNLIGNNNQIPWMLPGELKRFRKITMGKPIIMGRKTHESIGRVLDGRENIILTNNNLYKKEGALIFNNLNTIFKEFSSHKELMVIGGAEIYKLVLPFTNKLYLTHIHKKFHGDTWFPKICSSNWEIIEEEVHENKDIQIEYTYKTYFRISE